MKPSPLNLLPVKYHFNPEGIIHWEDFISECLPRVAYASVQPHPHLFQVNPHPGKCALVGGGPTVKNFVTNLRFYRGSYDIIMSLNGAHNWLIERGIIPNIHAVMELDVRELEMALGGKPHPAVTYYVASCCHESIFRDLKGYKCVIWHPELPPKGYYGLIARTFPDEFMVAGSGYTTFFRSMTIARILGFRSFDLYGCDCSFHGSSHVEGYAVANIEPRVKIWARRPDGETEMFITQGGLSYMASEFMKFCDAMPELSVRVHGDSLLRFRHEGSYPENYTKEQSLCLKPQI